MTWSNTLINKYLLEAELDLAKQFKCIYKRTSLKISANKGTYKLPADCIGIRRVTWLGKRLDPNTHLELVTAHPFIMGTSESGGFDFDAFSAGFSRDGEDSYSPSGTPTQYLYDFLGEARIFLYPVPNIAVQQYSSGLFGSNIINACIVTYSGLPDGDSVRVPDFMMKRAVRYYTLYKLYRIEGEGQNIEASDYFKNRYLQQKTLINKLLQDCHHTNRYTESLILNQLPDVFAGPSWPSNYPNIRN